MKRLFLAFLFTGIALLYFGCSENNPSAPELSQSDQVTNSFAKKPAPSLTCTTEYNFFGHLGIFDGEGRFAYTDGMTYSGTYKNHERWTGIETKESCTKKFKDGAEQKC